MPPIMVGIPYTRDITCSVRPNLSEEVWIHFFICEKKWANVSTQHGAKTETCFWPKKPYFQIEKLGCVQDVAFRVKTPCHKDSKGLLQLKKPQMSKVCHMPFLQISNDLGATILGFAESKMA